MSEIGQAVLRCQQAADAKTATTAWDYLVSLLTPKLLRMIRPLANSRFETKDVLQETLLRLTEKILTIRDPESVLAWCRRTALHLIIDDQRKSSRKPVILLEDIELAHDMEQLAPQPLSPSERTEQKDVWNVFEKTLADRNPVDGAFVIMHVIDGLTFPKIAEEAGISEDAVRMRVDRFLEAARMIYERDARRIP